MKKLNICLVAARRPELVRRTLQSFDRHLFRFCQVNQVRVNLDPIFGSKEDEAEVVRLVRSIFPDAEINIPSQPGFTVAVQWLWSSMDDGAFLHLEDDWVCLEDIPVETCINDLDEKTRMILLLSETHGERGKNRESVRIRKQKLLGLTYKRTAVPTFGTSPSITDGSFARTASALLDCDLDPEKQMRDQRNPELIEFLSGYRCLFQASADGHPLIQDIGRAWQRDNGVEKHVNAGVSKWSIETEGQ